MNAEPLIRKNIPLDAVIDFILRETGMTLPETNYKPVQKYISVKLEESGETLFSYLERIKNEPREYRHFIETVTIGETYFFREDKQFGLLKNVILPPLTTRKEPVLLWSASCSTGEEALSLALTARSVPGLAGSFTVYASDISETALNHFEKGWYGPNAFRQDGQEYHKFVHNQSEAERNGYRINPDLIQSIIRFRANLTDLPVIPGNPRFDIIFLRNTLIYFTEKKRNQVLGQILPCLRDGGCLFLSSTETTLVSHPELKLEEQLGRYYFRKIAPEIIPEAPRYKEKPVKAVPLHRAPGAARTAAPLPSDETAKLQEIWDLINSGNPDKGERVLKTWEDSGYTGPLTDFLRGTLALSRKDPETAFIWFKQCASDFPSFWPGRFHYALNCFRKKEYKNALKEFNRCRDLLTGKPDGSENRYSPLMEGFDRKYFLSLCSEHINRIEQGRAHGTE